MTNPSESSTREKKKTEKLDNEKNQKTSSLHTENKWSLPWAILTPAREWKKKWIQDNVKRFI